MRKGLFVLVVFVAAGIGGIIGALTTFRYLSNQPSYSSIDDRQKLNYAPVRIDTTAFPPKVNFKPVAKSVINAVVHVRISTGPGEFSINPLDHYLNSPARSSGSGVIVSDDGYIVTNFHVIEEARGVEVVLSNNERHYAKIIGTDPTTDLALLKIKSKGLPFVRYGDSDTVVPGEWVLAVGNPFDLNSTVTAGIVSGKARNIGILADRNNLHVEAFIQTDAAVNPGNSGGALVNLSGELIGINSAIATTTGSYSGYSFAIPVNLVRKVMDDLLEFGQVQRGILGIQIRDVTAELADAEQIEQVNGIFVSYVNPGSTAADAGIKPGDVITAIDQNAVTNVSELQERVARYRPGRRVLVTFVRNGQRQSAMGTLKSMEGSDKLIKRSIELDFDGAEFEDLSYEQLRQLKLDNGVRLKTLSDGRWKRSGLEKDFIIRFIDKLPIDNVADLNRVLEYKKGGILVEGVYMNGAKGTYGVDW
jgi:Do/DeqQ family serine protease